MNFAALKAEVLHDPVSIGYGGMSDAEVVESLMDDTLRVRTVAVTSNQLLAWSIYDGRLARIKAGIEGGVDNVEKSLCEACYIMLQRDNSLLDLNEQSRVDMLDALVSYGRLTSGERDSLYTLAAKTISRSEELGLGRVRPGDIAAVRA